MDNDPNPPHPMLSRRGFVGLAALAAASALLPRGAIAQAMPKAKNVVLVRSESTRLNSSHRP